MSFKFEQLDVWNRSLDNSDKEFPHRPRSTVHGPDSLNNTLGYLL
jgi:hypothetical protein